jgi:hypothetical protein
MTSPAPRSSDSPRLVAWIVAGCVVAGPLLFFALVTPPQPPEEPASVLPPPSSPSPLAAVGLRENRDWEGLPEIFAVWADRAHWVGGRTRFAWWHPGAQAHRYFFEARRTPSGIRFREIAEPKDYLFEWDPRAAPDSPLRLYLPIEVEVRAAPPHAPRP